MVFLFTFFVRTEREARAVEVWLKSNSQVRFLDYFDYLKYWTLDD